MNPWHKLPFLRLFLPFLPGIFLGLQGYGGDQSVLIILIVLIISQVLLLVYHRKLIPYSWRWLPGELINLFILVAGLRIGYQSYHPYASDYFGKHVTAGHNGCWILQIEGPLHEKEKTYKTTAAVLYYVDNHGIERTEGQIYLSFQKSEEVKNLKRGDCILVQGQIKEISGPVVPYSFDYQLFSARKGILFQLYLKQADWHLLSEYNKFSIRQLAWEWQQKLVEIIREQALGKDEQAVGCAMLLGYTDGFGQDLQGAYSRAGVTHILSVSGLHVGLVFIIFSRLLFFLNKNQGQKLLKTILLVILTWLYALLTGMAPCVQRAAFMFSLLIIGQSLKRKNNITNTLFGSAFILVWINPSNINDFGFQLSYFAVLGIVWLEPIVYNTLYINNSRIDKLWKLTAVTIAAQLATGPLASLHFHQFPVWFIPANLIVIPLSTLVMYLGIGLLVFAAVPFIGYGLKMLFGYSIMLMNLIVQQTDRLPFPVIEGLYPDLMMTASCYVSVLLGAAWLITSRKNYLFLTLTGVLFYTISLSINTINKSEERQLSIFSSEKTAVLAIHQQQTLDLITGIDLFADSSNLKRKLRPWILRNNIHKIRWHPDSLLKTICGQATPGINKVLWIHGKNKIIDSKSLDIKVKTIILSGKISRREKHLWKDLEKIATIDIRDISSEGCYLLTW